MAILSACAQSAAVSDGDAIVSIGTGKVGKQAIGNCWAYTTTAWLEALQFRVGVAAPDYSESYLSYWNMYESLMGRKNFDLEAAHFRSVAYLLSTRGLMLQSDFILEEASGLESTRQTKALANVKAWMKAGGLLRAPTDELKKRAYIRAALDNAWELSARRRAALDRAFGPNVTKTIADATDASYSSFLIYRPADIKIAVYQPGADEPRAGVLSEVAQSYDSYRESDFKTPNARLFSVHFPTATDVPFNGWSGYPSGYFLTEEGAVTVPSQRALWRKMQRVLHQGIPIWGAWWVDASAQDKITGNFVQQSVLLSQHDITNKSVGPHASLFIDYQARLADGSLLAVGKTETDKNRLAAALKDDTRLELFRIQNSWGANPVWRDRPAGTYDLGVDYLATPGNQKCLPGGPDKNDTVAPECYSDAFMGEVMLPLNLEP